MGRRWERFRNPWEREYAMRGELWRGTSPADFLRAWVPDGARVVDLGCGDGKFTAGLAGAGYVPVGVDFSRRGLALARARYRAALLAGDARALPFATGSVDAVAARYVLGALDEAGRGRAAAEIERVVSPGGTVVVEEFGRGDFRYGTGTEVERNTFERNRGILTHYFDADEGPGLLPSLVVVDGPTRLATKQRIGAGARDRERWRWILRSPSK